MQITITIKSKNFSRDSETLILVGWIFFVQNVGNENCLAVPPVTMITKAIHYLYASRAIGTVIVPFWPSAYFWPVITRNFGITLLVMKSIKESGYYGTAGAQIHC